jgi:hypothetical protein
MGKTGIYQVWRYFSLYMFLLPVFQAYTLLPCQKGIFVPVPIKLYIIDKVTH